MGAGDTAWEAGLGIAVALDKPGGFIGRDALATNPEAQLPRRLVHLVLDDAEAYPIGGEPILYRGEPVGQVTSTAFGHTVSAAVAIGYIERPLAAVRAMIENGGVALDIGRRAWSAQAGLKAPLAP